jgi:hypothetical protein
MQSLLFDTYSLTQTDLSSLFLYRRGVLDAYLATDICQSYSLYFILYSINYSLFYCVLLYSVVYFILYSSVLYSLFCSTLFTIFTTEK